MTQSCSFLKHSPNSIFHRSQEVSMICHRFTFRANFEQVLLRHQNEHILKNEKVAVCILKSTKIFLCSNCTLRFDNTIRSDLSYIFCPPVMYLVPVLQCSRKEALLGHYSSNSDIVHIHEIQFYRLQLMRSLQFSSKIEVFA